MQHSDIRTAVVRNSTDPIIVAFCGAKFHGKDTAAQPLIEKYGFKQVSFADGLKQCISTALRVPVSVLNDPAMKETIHAPSGKTYREWLQIAGTEWFRSMWDGIWISWWEEEIKEKGYERVVTTDLRFPNELKAVRAKPNNFVVRVVNPFKPAHGDTHASEAHQASFVVDDLLMNDGDVADLQAMSIAITERKFGSELYFS